MCNTMVKLLLSIFFILSCSVPSRQIQETSLIDINGKEIILSTDKDYLLLITTTDCGYCLINSPYFNSVSQEFGNYYQCIALYETGKNDIETQGEEYKDMIPPLTNWIIVPDAYDTYIEYVDKETYPQILVVHKGEIVKVSVGTIQKVQDDLKLFLRTIVESDDVSMITQ